MIRPCLPRVEAGMKDLAVTLMLIASAGLLFSNPAAAVSNNQGASGRYRCECKAPGNDDAAGSCSTEKHSWGISCVKAAGDTCTATCTMVTQTQGATGGGLTISPGASQKSAPTLQKAP
jgi:hypothetical protein